MAASDTQAAKETTPEGKQRRNAGGEIACCSFARRCPLLSVSFEKKEEETSASMPSQVRAPSNSGSFPFLFFSFFAPRPSNGSNRRDESRWSMERWPERTGKGVRASVTRNFFFPTGRRRPATASSSSDERSEKKTNPPPPKLPLPLSLPILSPPPPISLSLHH